MQLKELPEVQQIRSLYHLCDQKIARVNELGRINVNNKSFPINSFVIGTDDPSAPCLGLFGGVHGLERVGTHIIIAYLESLLKRIKWDRDLCHQLQTSRIVSIPLINPGGMALFKRSNPQGIDIMRNAPVDGDSTKMYPLLSGHRLSNRLPWYRGPEGSDMEKETKIVIDFVRQEVFPSKTAIVVDFHSGFGMKDRFWYPYAKSKEQYPRIREVQAIKDLLDESVPHHVYSVEPQSYSYNTHGDMWDYLFDEHFSDPENKEKLFLPWTLEMGSWNWVKKNPRQIFSPLGLYNPMIDHRYNRTMRRHKPLIDFLFSATRHPEGWKLKL